VKDYSLVVLDSVQVIACGDGLTFDGDSTILSVKSTSCLAMVSGGTLFKAGATLAVSSSSAITNGTYVMPAGTTMCDFVAANITSNSGFEVNGNTITGAGTFFSNLDGDNIKCHWHDNNFEPASAETNTYVGAHWEMTAEAATVVSVAATDYKVLGTTTYVNEAWFSSATDNAFVYDSDVSVKVEIKGAVSITGTNGNNIQLKIRKWDDSAAGYVDIQTVPAREMSGTGAAASVAILAYTTLDSPDDRIELWGQNVGATNNFVVKDNSVFAITERAN
jgi:hypothetical protein